MDLQREFQPPEGLYYDTDSEECLEPIRPVQTEEFPKQGFRFQIYNLPRKLRSSKPRNVKEVLKKTYNDYAEDSTLHGMPYFHAGNKWEKVVWSTLFIISLTVCSFMVKTQFDRWKSAPVLISFARQEMPVYDIPFPAVTVCSESKSVKSSENTNFTRFYVHLNKFRYTDKPVEKPDWLNEAEYKQMRALLHICGNYLTDGLTFADNEPVAVIDHLNEIGFPLNGTFIFCSFNHDLEQCDSMFLKVYTEEGICYTFNSLNNTEIYRPSTYQYQQFVEEHEGELRDEILEWDIQNGYYFPSRYDTFPDRVIGSGPLSGLIVGLQGHEKHADNVCRGPVQGFKMILHSPDEIPQVDRQFIHVPYNRDILVLVKPEYISTTEPARKYTPFQRDCYLPHERYLKYFSEYTQNNCELECLANFTLQECGCVQFSMPRLVDEPVCNEQKISCYDKAEYHYLIKEFAPVAITKEACRCLPGCFNVKYDYEVSGGVVNMEHISEDSARDKAKGNDSLRTLIRIIVHFKFNEFIAKERSELYSSLDLLANMGGLFGLFLGISALSLIEVIYHFCIRFGMNIRELKRNSASRD